ncbi:MAG: carboxypeptidase-like regulatory domain-containing protein [Cyclobacteriaceae bacterium]
MKPIRAIFFLFIVATFAYSLESKGQSSNELNGIVLDESGKDPIANANIYLKGSHLGTISNSDGKFSIKIPKDYLDGVLVFSSIGFDVLEIAISDFSFDDKELKIILKNSIYVLNPVQVYNSHLILKEAINKIPVNYPEEFQGFTAFYREVIKKNKSYVDISQGILNISKTPYSNTGKKYFRERDRISVRKGHRITNYSKRDTLAFKVMGGPYTMMLLDIVKNPGVVLGAAYFEHYEYGFEGIEIIDGRRSYILSFKEKLEADVALYEGKIYVDEETLAIAGLKFSMPDESLWLMKDNLIQDKPSSSVLTPKKLAYEVRYRESGGKWFLDYVRNDIVMKVNWSRRLFNSTFNATTELVVTDKRPVEDQLVKYDAKMSTRYQDLFSDQVYELQNSEYWEDFSIIRPEDDLKKVLSQIAKN